VLPDHTHLPETDGSIVQNFQEHPQAMLLSDTLRPVLDQLHPDGQYAVGQDSGIYFRVTDPPLDGCKAPDWFYVPDVPPMLDGRVRRSYVLWQELIAPVLLVEFVSGNGSDERDTTPWTGKFWVYERVVRADYYAIYEVELASVELYRLVDRRYQRVPANERGHFPVPALGIEAGIWQGWYQNLDLPWLRFWDSKGVLLPTQEERAAAERERADRERERAEKEHKRAEKEQERAESAEQRAERLAARLRALGIDPNQEEGPAAGTK
jgi:Uma2 family endonuclease